MSAERAEGIRQWAVEQAVKISPMHNGAGAKRTEERASDVLAAAKRIEAYVTGGGE